MGPSFKVKFVKFHTCRSRKQYTGPNKKNTNAQNATHTAIQTHDTEPTICSTVENVIVVICYMIFQHIHEVECFLLYPINSFLLF